MLTLAKHVTSHWGLGWSDLQALAQDPSPVGQPAAVVEQLSVSAVLKFLSLRLLVQGEEIHNLHGVELMGGGVGGGDGLLDHLPLL